MATATELIQDFAAGRIVTLFILEVSGIDPFYFTNTLDANNNPIVFDGITYSPIPIEVDGFERTINGSQPRPTLRVGNTNQALNSILYENNDLVGARVTRERTFERFLDAGAEPDPTQTFGREVYNINRKVTHNKVFVEFELAHPIDQQNLTIPVRKMFKRYCSHTYRRYNATTQSYIQGSCPYAAPEAYDRWGAAAAPADDVCAKHADACALRFGEGTPLPIRAAPGMSNVR